MKAILVSFLSAMLISGFSFAQCSSAVPPDAEIVKTAGTTKTLSNQKYWVCANASLILTGDMNQIWIEPDGILSVNGMTNTMYLKADAKATVSGVDNIAYVDQNANANFNDQGNNTSKTICKPSVFDYTSAPENGCTNPTGIEGVITVKKAEIFPNPASDNITLSFPNKEVQNVTVSIYDMNGKLLNSRVENANGGLVNLDVSSLSNGIYTIQALGENTMVNEQFTIQR